MDRESEDARVVFVPSGRRGRFALGTSVLDAGRHLGVDIDSLCGGRSLCGRCQIEVAEGDFPKHGVRSGADHLTPVGAAEAQCAERRRLKPGRRLSCQARISGDLVIDVPPDSQVHRPMVRKPHESRAIAVDPVLRLLFVQVEAADINAPTADLRRLQAALATQWGLSETRADLSVIRALGPALQAGIDRVTVAVRHGRELIGVWPGLYEAAYGLAVDVGSTTLAGHLCDLATGAVVASAGAMNPQIRFGEDLMSRVSHIMTHPEAAAQLTGVVRAALNALAADAAHQAGIDTEAILEVTVVGNPIMHHLLFGIDPTPLGTAPFPLAVDDALEIRATELGLSLHPGARVYALPCIAGHVGADTAAVVLAEAPHQRDEISLLVDVGTNAELVLGNRDRLLAASSPTGPALEGAQISCGQRAAPGAIERVRIDPETLDARVKVIGSELWSDQDGFAASVAKTGVTGLCGSGLIEAVAELYLAGLLSPDGLIDGTLAARTARLVPEGRTFRYTLYDGPEATEPLCLTQADIRAVQLAKAALAAGARLLMDRLGVDRLDRIVLAGAFGSHIDVKHAMILGLIPDCALESVVSAGNAAGTGARIALLNAAARQDIERVVRRIEKIETAVEPSFQAHFVDALAIPHKNHPYPQLRRSVHLPDASPPVATDAPDPPRRRRGRIARTAAAPARED